MTRQIRFGVLLLSVLLVGMAVAQTTVVTVEQTDKIQPSGVASGDAFGSGVSIDGATMVVGSDGDDGANTLEGSVYVYELSGGSWTESVRVTASSATALDENFGSSVALDGGRFVVGAPRWNQGGSNAGLVFVFEGSGSSWSEVATVSGSDTVSSDFFGNGVGLAGTTLIVGAPHHGTGGAVYVFELSGGSWVQQTKITPGNVASGDEFGYDIGYDGTTLVVGARSDDDTATDAGSVYVFEGSGSSWSQTAKFQSADIAGNDRFGNAVAVEGDIILAASLLDDDTAADSGSVYVFEFSDGSWGQVDKFQSNDIATNDRFGSGIGISGSIVAVGAPEEDDTGSNAGSVYVFDFFVDTEPAPDPEPGGGAPFFGDDGALFGGDKSALGDSLQVTETALDFIMGIMLTLIFAAGGFLLLGLLGALMGAGFGFIVAFAFGLFPLWVLIFILVLAAAFYYLRSNANG